MTVTDDNENDENFTFVLWGICGVNQVYGWELANLNGSLLCAPLQKKYVSVTTPPPPPQKKKKTKKNSED